MHPAQKNEDNLRECTVLYLHNYWHNPFSLVNVEQFIKRSSGGLSTTVEEGNYTKLVDVMGHLMAVKDRQPAIDGMFEPLKQTIDLLKTYGQEMSEDVHHLLQVK